MENNEVIGHAALELGAGLSHMTSEIQTGFESIENSIDLLTSAINSSDHEDLVSSLYDVQMAIESLNRGDLYGDTIVDSLGDIATSLRVLSGRSKWKNGKEVTQRIKETAFPWYFPMVTKIGRWSYNRRMKNFDSLPEDEQVLLTIEKAWFDLTLKIYQNRERISVDGSFYFELRQEISSQVDIAKKYFETHEDSPQVKHWYRLFKQVKDLF